MILRDYGAVCLALSLAMSVYQLITEYVGDCLYHEHARTSFESNSMSYDEITNLFW